MAESDITASLLPAFDPRQVPVVGVDAHLSPVAHTALTPDALRRRFAHPPVWQPELLAEKKYMKREPAKASVLIPIVMRETPTVLLTQRTQQMSTHSGQIAFPGGKQDPEDADRFATALRETEEELGLSRAFVDILGALPLYVTGSSFVVSPVVALVQPGFEITLNKNEVEDAFEVPLAFLMNPAHHRHHVVQTQGVERRWLSMPYPDATSEKGTTVERFIWGATAGMLRNLYRFLSA